MTAQVMKCTSVKNHPNADALMVYNFESKANGSFTVVANMENTYEVGDLVEVVMSGSVMKDGVKIQADKVRGLLSHGMAVGKSDLEFGTDVTDKHCKKIEGFSFMAWPSIGAVYNVRKDLKATEELKSVTYRAKVKLHGTNAAIHFNGTDIGTQSRKKMITPEKDNAGFSRWAFDKDWSFTQIVVKEMNTNVIVYGEWAGPGIQKGTSVSCIDKKIFAVFAVQVSTPTGEQIVYEPHRIAALVQESDDVFILPWASEDIVLDYEDPEKLENQLEVVNNLVADVERCDPWVKKVFGVEGTGEGVVMYPVGVSLRADLSELIFKAKGEKHKVTADKKPAQASPEVAKSVDEFVKLMVTEGRLDQISSEIGEFDIKKTGQFIKAFAADVEKESSAQLDAANITWKDVAKSVNARAGAWWKDKCKESSLS